MTALPPSNPTRQEIDAALSDPNPNPLADSVAHAIAAYAQQFREAVGRQGGFTQPIRLPQPRNNVEARAFELFVAEVRSAAPGARVLAVHERERP